MPFAGKRADAVRIIVMGTARQVYAEMGWGWSEAVYREALARDLRALGLHVATEVAMPVIYKGEPLSNVSVRWDMVVAHCVLIELKAVRNMGASALRQCQRYAAVAVDPYRCAAINFPDRPAADLQWLT